MFPNLLIIKGDEGVYYLDENSKCCHEPAVKTEKVVETNGAGDTFIGYLLVRIAKGENFIVALRKSIYAATLEIQKLGVLNTLPYYKEVEKLYKQTFEK